MSERGLFNGKTGFIIATAASAVGLGNIWRFPTEAAKHGGGSFVLIYIVIVILFGLTMMVTEIAIGRKTRRSPIEAYGSLDKRFRFIGMLSSWVPAIILPYYCVIGGWLLGYLFGYSAGFDLSDGATVFSDFVSSYECIVTFAAFAIIVAVIIYLGVSKGIERFSIIFMPIFLVLLVGLTIYVLTLPGAGDGVAYYFEFRLSDVDGQTFIAALGQAFFSLSIAMGILITYGSYMSSEENIERCSLTIIIIDTAVAIVAGLMIIPMAYTSMGGDISGGAGLVFITLPHIFGGMGMGRVVAILFFVMISFAAITSAVSVLEAVASTVMDSHKISRNRAVTIVMIPTFAAGVLIALGYGPLDFIQIAGKNLLDIFDYVSNTIMMPVVAFLMCIFVGHVIGTKVVTDEIEKNGEFKTKTLYVFFIKWICPILVALILAGSFIKF